MSNTNIANFKPFERVRPIKLKNSTIYPYHGKRKGSSLKQMRSTKARPTSKYYPQGLDNRTEIYHQGIRYYPHTWDIHQDCPLYTHKCPALWCYTSSAAVKLRNDVKAQRDGKAILTPAQAKASSSSLHAELEENLLKAVPQPTRTPFQLECARLALMPNGMDPCGTSEKDGMDDTCTSSQAMDTSEDEGEETQVTHQMYVGFWPYAKFVD